MGTDEAGRNCLGPGVTHEAMLSLAADAARPAPEALPGLTSVGRAVAAVSSALRDTDAAVLVQVDGSDDAASFRIAAGCHLGGTPPTPRSGLGDLLRSALARRRTVVVTLDRDPIVPPTWQRAGIRWAAAIPFGEGSGVVGGMVVRSRCQPPDDGTLAFLETMANISALGLGCESPPPTNAGRQEMTQLLDALIQGQEEERARISRELHDETNQSITSLILGLALLARTIDDDPTRQQIVQLRDQAAEALDGLRRVAQGLRPVALEELGLGPALESLCEAFSNRYGIRARFYHVDQDCPCRSVSIDVALYRIVQEALANVARHAEATEVGIVLACRGGLITVQIEDDGNGCARAAEPPDAPEQLGILGMKERAALLGGKVSVESNPGHGTTVYVEIPASPEGQGDP